jgi:hypothetical protein
MVAEDKDFDEAADPVRIVNINVAEREIFSFSVPSGRSATIGL